MSEQLTDQERTYIDTMNAEEAAEAASEHPTTAEPSKCPTCGHRTRRHDCRDPFHALMPPARSEVEVLRRAENALKPFAPLEAWPIGLGSALPLIRDLASSLRAALARAEKAEGERDIYRQDGEAIRLAMMNVQADLDAATEQVRVLREAIHMYITITGYLPSESGGPKSRAVDVLLDALASSDAGAGQEHPANCGGQYT